MLNEIALDRGGVGSWFELSLPLTLDSVFANPATPCVKVNRVHRACANLCMGGRLTLERFPRRINSARRHMERRFVDSDRADYQRDTLRSYLEELRLKQRLKNYSMNPRVTCNSGASKAAVQVGLCSK